MAFVLLSLFTMSGQVLSIILQYIIFRHLFICYSNNIASLNAVKKLGFIHAGTVLRHHMDQAAGEYVDDIIFHKLLED